MTSEIEPTTTETPILNEVIDNEKCGKYVAMCKWFNDKLGFGFVTIWQGQEKGKDIFVHHSSIKPANSIYKTLKKGEYINFNIIDGMNGLQAVDVTGINGGPLMCDHVIGKKTNDTPVLDGSQNMQQDWQQVPAHVRHPIAPPPPPSTPNRGRVPPKRYPPNTRPYKKNLKTKV